MRGFLFIAALALPLAAQATCIGGDAFQTCTDMSGNSYNVQRYGNTTQMQGYNAATGSNWSQSSSTYGNTTYHNGTAANGNSWSGTTSNFGGTTIYQGTNSSGQSYYKTCNAYGCF